MSGVVSVVREHENFLWLMANEVSQSMIELTEQMSTVLDSDQDHSKCESEVKNRDAGARL